MSAPITFTVPMAIWKLVPSLSPGQTSTLLAILGGQSLPDLISRTIGHHVNSVKAAIEVFESAGIVDITNDPFFIRPAVDRWEELSASHWKTEILAAEKRYRAVRP